MKKNITFLFIMLSCMLSFNSFAHDIEVVNADGIPIYYIWNTDKTELAVSYRGSKYFTYSNEYSDNVVIPESVTYEGKNYNVTSIGEFAFYNCSGLSSVVIPNSVISIGGAAFCGCIKLDSISIPWNVNYIGAMAFENCSSLSKITIPNRVKTIKSSTFEGCSRITSITIPDSVTSIGSSAFRNCSSLTSIIIPDSVTSIGNSAFYGCKNLISASLGNKVTSISDRLFGGCEKITSFTIPNSVTKIINKAFDGCSNLKTVVIGSGINSIATSAFDNTNIDKIIWLSGTPPSGYNSVRGKINYVSSKEYSSLSNTVIYPFLSSFFEMEGLGYVPMSPEENDCAVINYSNRKESIRINENVYYDGISYCISSIGDYAFYGCSELNMVDIPNSVTYIGEQAFYDCSCLDSVTIPNSVTSISSDAFQGCTGIKYLSLHCPKIESWFSGMTSIKRVIIGEGVTNVSSKAFFGCSGLMSVLIPNSVISIGNSSFQDCSNLSSVIIGSGVRSIGTDAFKNTHLAKTIWLTNTPPSGYKYAKGIINYVSNTDFSSLNDTIVYPFLSSNFEVDGIRYVPISPSERTCDAIDCVYNESAEDTNISSTTVFKGITMTVKNIQPYFAYNNKFIKRLIIDNDGEITYNAFRGCSNVKSVTLGAKVSVIGEYAFQGCSSLEAIDIPDAVKSIDSYAFSGCSSILSAKIGSGIETINNYSFSGCSSMKELTIGSQVKIIDQYAFQNCIALSSITIPRAVTEIRDYVFYGCSNLKKVIMNDSEEELKLGSNGSTPFFSSCPLDSVYIGRNISYNTSSDNGYSPFYRNNSLRVVNITDKENEISMNEFYGCKNLQRVIIGDGVTSIGYRAFSGCQSLNYFMFGAKVTSIGKEAFSDCNAMKEIVSKAVIPPVCESQAMDDINKWECKLYVPKGYLSAYQTANQWKDFFFMEEGTGSNYSGIVVVASQPILILSEGGTIKVSGVDNGTHIYVYDINGKRSGFAVSQSGSATIKTSLQLGSVAIIKVGQKSIKITL